jgi:myo-inositol-1(or 4)-monophosphatase
LALNPIYLTTAVEAALACGRIHQKHFGGDLGVQKKGTIDLVTKSDIEAEAEFRRLIQSRFPTHSIWGEEGQGADTRRPPDPAPSGFRWIIDPLDGTTNFAHGLPVFCVSMALQVHERLEVGVVYAPLIDELFTAERGEGARLNGRRIQVTSRADLIDSLVVTGFPYSIVEHRRRQVEVFSQFLGLTRGVRRLGSAAIDLCWTAAGRFEAFYEEQLHAWDIAAGMVIVEEAGGRVTDYALGPVDLLKGQIIASNGPIHEPLRRVILNPAHPD